MGIEGRINQCFFVKKKMGSTVNTYIKSIGSNEEDIFSDGAHDLRVLLVA